MEIDTARAEEVKKNYHLTDTVVIHADDFQKVQGSIYCIYFIILMCRKFQVLVLIFIRMLFEN